MIVFIILTLCVNYINGFNLDIGETIWRLSRKNATNFGHSVSLYQGGDGNSVIVGAPNGAPAYLFKCTNATCAPLDIKNNKPTNDRETNPQYGQSITSNGDSVLTCGHLWSRAPPRYNFQGQCILSKKNLDKPTYIVGACDNETGPFNSGFGYCVSGFSSTGFSTQSNMPFYFVGAPGSLRYRGAIYGIYGNSSSPIVERALGYEPELASSHLGYSIAWGKFDDAIYGSVVAGAPRDKNLQGTVVIYAISLETKILNYLDQIDNPDKKVGTLFGASVCVIDYNNDGRDDLLVGAPLYSGRYKDEGRIYIFENVGEASVITLEHKGSPLTGESNWARFGTTIANIGDTNGDGYKDFAVGAPYRDNEEKGVVYIYLGQDNHLFAKSQVIRATDVPNGGGMGFGKSISGGVDIDGNLYPDLAIGSPQSKLVFLFRSNPVITLSDNVKLSNVSVPFVDNCPRGNGDTKKYHCLTLSLNLQYEGKGTQNTAVFEVTIELDNTTPTNKRAFIAENNRLTTKHVRNETLRKTPEMNQIPIKVYFAVEDATIDISQPIHITSTYKLYKDPAGCSGMPCSVLDQLGKKSTTIKVSYLQECGDDEICRPDVAVTNPRIYFAVNNQTDIVFGGPSKKFTLQVDVANVGEEAAYEANMKLNYSTDFIINSIDADGKILFVGQDLSVTKLDLQLSQAQFRLGNDIKPNEKFKLNVHFEVFRSQPSKPVYNFPMVATALGIDNNTANNAAQMKIGAKISSCIDVSSNINKPSVRYSTNATKPSEIQSLEQLGTEVIYEFKIRNNGRSLIGGLSTTICLDGQRNGNDILYIVDIKVGGRECIGPFNPLNLKIPVIFKNESTFSRRRRDVSSTDPCATKEFCNGGNCQSYVLSKLSCGIDAIAAQDSKSIIMTTRLYDANAAKLQLQTAIITADIEVKFNGANSDLIIQQEKCKLNQESELLVRGDPEIPTTSWWKMMLAVIGSLIFLAIVTAILYWCGFFKPPKSFEKLQEEESKGKHSPNKSYLEDDE